MIKTQQDEPLKGLQEAVMNAALNDAVNAQAATEKAVGNGKEHAKGGVSPLNGVRTPAGRPKGVRNRLTSIRDAVIEAFDEVGGTEYLVRLANGTQSDRAAFVSVINKVLPSQINANVDGGIKLELSWLGSRNIGTTQAQIAEPRTQVLDLEQDSNGGYRIKDQQPQAQAADGGGGSAGPEAQKGQEGV